MRTELLQHDAQLEKISARYARLSPDPALAAGQVEPLQQDRDDLLIRIDALIAKHHDYSNKRHNYYNALSNADNRLQASMREVELLGDGNDVSLNERQQTLRVSKIIGCNW